MYFETVMVVVTLVIYICQKYPEIKVEVYYD